MLCRVSEWARTQFQVLRLSLELTYALWRSAGGCLPSKDLLISGDTKWSDMSDPQGRKQNAQRQKDGKQSEKPDVLEPVRNLILRFLGVLDLLVYTLVGLAFIAAALLALAFSVAHLVANFGINLPLQGVVQNVLTFISDLLLVLIIMEVLSTVRSYLKDGDTSVKPFLFIGIISATRSILSIGARLSIEESPLTGDPFRNAMIELAVDALVIIVLGVTIRVMGKAADLPEEAPEEIADHVEDIHDQVQVQTTVTTRQHHDPVHDQE